MKKGTLETTVGVFVLIGILCTVYLAIRLGKMELIGSNYYYLEARFSSVAGLAQGGRVEIAGVQVGSVDKISIDPQRMQAVTSLKIRKDIVLAEDSKAAIKTSGIIGDKYVLLTPGGSDDNLADGGRIYDTIAPLDIEELISKYLFGSIK